MGLYAQSCAAEMRHDGGYAGRGWSRWTVHRWMKVGMDEQVDRQVTVQVGHISSGVRAELKLLGVLEGLYWFLNTYLGYSIEMSVSGAINTDCYVSSSSEDPDERVVPFLQS